MRKEVFGGGEGTGRKKKTLVCFFVGAPFPRVRGQMVAGGQFDS